MNPANFFGFLMVNHKTDPLLLFILYDRKYIKFSFFLLNHLAFIEYFLYIVSLYLYCMQSLYNEGGRKFWIHNTGPFGCLPKLIVLSQKKDLDSFGCLSSYNSAAKLFNEALYHSSQKLRTELKDATIVYVDIYAIKNDLITNATKYGKLCNHFHLIKHRLLMDSQL
jgi:hypothetical protein